MATGGLNDKDIPNHLKMFEDPAVKVKHNFCNPCKFDNSEDIARGFCTACCEYLCKTCCREHYKNKVTRNHAVLKDQDFPEDIAPFLAIKALMKCSVHKYEEVTHECADHSCLICVTCITEKHRQCSEVKKIESENRKNANAFDMEKIASLQIKAIDCKLRLECNTLCQLVEKEISDIKNVEVKSKTIERVEKINSDLQNTMELSLKSEIHTNLKATNQCNLIEGELKELQNMTSAISEYGSAPEKAIFSKHVGKRIHDLVSKLECLEISSTLHFTTENPGIEKIMIENSSDDVMNEDIFRTSDKNNTCSYSNQETQTDDTQRNIQKNKTVHQTNNIKRPFIVKELFISIGYLIRTYTDRYPCDVLALQQLFDGRFLLADHSNRKLKLFDKHFGLIRDVSLRECPTDICINQRGIFVCFSTSKYIQCFTIDGQSEIHETTRFPTRFQAVSLSSFDEERILILFLKNSFFDDSEADDVVIEVRDGSAIDARKEFPDGNVEFANVEYAKRICTISTSSFILAEDERVSCYSPDMEDACQDEREWYYKSHGNKFLQKARGMCLDSEGNVYICGEESYNVHQVSSHNYRESRVLIENIRQPIAVVMDEFEDRLIVSCRNDDY